MSKKIAVSIAAAAAVVALSSQAFARQPGNFELAQEVKKTMGVNPTNIKVRAQDGKVTLSGVVTTPLEREYAISAAKNTPGVISVIDDIDVDSRGF